jgi:hypothetical protein
MSKSLVLCDISQNTVTHKVQRHKLDTFIWILSVSVVQVWWLSNTTFSGSNLFFPFEGTIVGKCRSDNQRGISSDDGLPPFLLGLSIWNF